MERVVYCPSEDSLDEAKQMARSVLLPIVIGESDRTSKLTFDKSVVSVIEIPRIRRFGIANPEVLLGMHQLIYVIDEFCGDNIGAYSVRSGNLEVSKMYTEKYTAKWSLVASNQGLNTADIFYDDEKVASIEYYVH